MGKPTAGQLARNNQMAREPLAEDQVYTFSAKLIGDKVIPSRYQRITSNFLRKIQKSGVKVRIITDHQEAQNRSQIEQLKILRDVGIPIKENSHKGLMHLKVTIADQATVTTGSYNYSNAASTINDEVLTVIHDPNMVKEWETQFERMWNDGGNFKDLK